MISAPPPDEVFGDYVTLDNGTSVYRRPNGTAQVEKFEGLKAALRDVHAKPDLGAQRMLARVKGSPAGPAEPDPRAATALETIEKSVSPDVLASIAPQLDRLKAVQADIGKEWTVNAGSTGNPLGTGYVAYDLQAPAKYLVPHTTPLRNRTPRSTNGVGTTGRYKRVTGVTNSGTGGVADLSPFFNSETASFTSGGVSGLRRPAQISYAGDEFAILYQEQGMSDVVSMKYQYEGQGYEDIRQLSQTALLWATMVGEEKSLLYARGSATGFDGAISAPTGLTYGSAAAAGTGQTGNTADVANLYVYVVANSGRGYSVPSSVAHSTALASATGDVLPISWTDSVGALGYTIYAGTTTGIANAYLWGTSQTNSFTGSFTGGGTGGVPNSGAQPSASDSSADVNAYDGFLTVLSNTSVAGYVGRLNGNFSTGNPGTEYQTAFENLYYNGLGLGYTQLADPNVIWIYPKGRVALSDLLKTSNSANYRLTLDADGINGMHLGNVVTGIQNEITSRMVDLEVHPYMPSGCSIIHSETLPIPDSQVGNTVEVRNVVDYTAIEWAQIQMSYDTSTYMLGSPLFYAPAWSGTLLGIGN